VIIITNLYYNLAQAVKMTLIVYHSTSGLGLMYIRVRVRVRVRVRLG